MAAREVRRQLHDDDSQGWLALDRGGFVGWFDPDRVGARPVEALEAAEASLSSLDAARVIPCGYRLDRAGFFLNDAEEHSSGGSYYRLVFVADPSAIALAYLHPGVGGLSAALLPSGADLERLHEEGACRGCLNVRGGFTRTSVAESLDLDEPDYFPHRFRGARALTYPSYGCYGYVHLEPSPSQVAAPYGRRFQPQRPLHVDQLPPALASLIGRCVLPLRFAETAWIQPAELTYCALEGRRYLSLTGRVFRSG